MNSTEIDTKAIAAAGVSLAEAARNLRRAMKRPLPLSRRRPAFDRELGDVVSGTFAFAITRATERARATGVRQIVTASPYTHPDIDAPGPWYRIQAVR